MQKMNSSGEIKLPYALVGSGWKGPDEQSETHNHTSMKLCIKVEKNGTPEEEEAKDQAI